MVKLINYFFLKTNIWDICGHLQLVSSQNLKKSPNESILKKVIPKQVFCSWENCTEPSYQSKRISSKWELPSLCHPLTQEKVKDLNRKHPGLFHYDVWICPSKARKEGRVRACMCFKFHTIYSQKQLPFDVITALSALLNDSLVFFDLLTFLQCFFALLFGTE